MTVAELIRHLNKFDPNLPVAYQVYSEQALLDADEVKLAELCEPRPDGWVQNYRPDKPTRLYVLFPGN